MSSACSDSTSSLRRELNNWLPTQDLTGQVVNMEPYYFAHGGIADVWMGQWIPKDSKNVEVQTYFLAS